MTFDFGQFSLTPPQQAVLRCMFARPNAQVLAGGSGMGGKSYVLRIAAVFYLFTMAALGYKGLAVLFTCNNYQSLRDRHFKQFTQFFGRIGRRYRDHEDYGNCFLLHGGIGAICFRNLEAMEERRGSEYAAWFHDETTESSAQMFGNGLYQIRSDIPFSPVVTASNPDGIGFNWVKETWRPHLLNRSDYLKCDYEEIRGARRLGYSTKVDPEGRMNPLDYIYIPFAPDDNPKFDEAKFWRGVEKLALHVQKARRYGSWDAPEGARFPMLAVEYHQFNMEKLWRAGLPAAFDKHLSVDYGIANPYAALWRCHDREANIFVYDEDYGPGFTPMEQIRRIMDQTSQSERLLSFKGDPQMWIKTPDHFNSDPPTVASIYNDAIRGDERFKCGFTPGPGGLRAYKWTVLERYLQRGNGFPDIWVADHCENLWDELTGAQFYKGTNPNKREDLDEKCADHALTALYYGIEVAVSKTEEGRAAREQRPVPDLPQERRSKTKVSVS